MSTQEQTIRTLMEDLAAAKIKIAGLEAENRALRSFWQAEKKEVAELRRQKEAANIVAVIAAEFNAIYAPGTK